MDQSEQNKIRASNIRAVWDALLAPNWTRDDLIDLGKAIFARKSLKDLDPKRFDTLLPRLVEIVERLEAKFTPGTPSETATSTPERVPGASGAVGPTGCTTGPAGESSTFDPRTSKPAAPRPSHAPAVLHAADRPDTPTNSASKEVPTIDVPPSWKE